EDDHAADDRGVAGDDLGPGQHAAADERLVDRDAVVLDGGEILHPVGAGVEDEGVGTGAAPELVVALSADKAVVAAAAVEVVVAGPAVDRIGAVVAAQAVVLGRTVEILDGDQRVAGGDAGVDARVCQVDTDANVAFAVVGGIGTRAAIQDVLVRAAEQYVVAALAVDPVVAPATEQPIVAGAALDHVCAVAAAQVVGKSGPDNVLHAGKAVAEGLAEVQ